MTFSFHGNGLKWNKLRAELLRDGGSWYQHTYVLHGYTNHGEVLGAGIGPGSNSHYISINRIRKEEKIGLSLEIIDQDNDFYHEAFASAKDYRRYWKDFNFHLNFQKKLIIFGFLQI